MLIVSSKTVAKNNLLLRIRSKKHQKEVLGFQSFFTKAYLEGVQDSDNSDGRSTSARERRLRSFTTVHDA